MLMGDPRHSSEKGEQQIFLLSTLKVTFSNPQSHLELGHEDSPSVGTPLGPCSDHYMTCAIASLAVGAQRMCKVWVPVIFPELVSQIDPQVVFH